MDTFASSIGEFDGLTTKINDVNRVSGQLAEQLARYRDALEKLSANPFVTKMRTLQNDIL